MRKILYKIWIPRKTTGSAWDEETISGTGIWSDFKEPGTLHCWGLALSESRDGSVNYSIGLVERADGSMIEVLPSNVKFIDPAK